MNRIRAYGSNYIKLPQKELRIEAYEKKSNVLEIFREMVYETYHS